MYELNAIVQTVVGVIAISGAVKLFFGKAINGHINNKKDEQKRRSDVEDLQTRMSAIETYVARDYTKLKVFEEAVAQMQAEQKLTLRALLGVCRRMEQQGANGCVSSVRKELEDYLIRK